MTKQQSGFTLIELMIVVAIIGILAAIAIPQYGAYTQRSKLSGALSSTGAWKAAVELCIQEQGLIASCATPNTNGIPADMTTAGTLNFVSSITTGAAGAITVVSTAIASDGVTVMSVTMTPSLVDSVINWTLSGNGCTDPTRSLKCVTN